MARGLPLAAAALLLCACEPGPESQPVPAKVADPAPPIAAETPAAPPAGRRDAELRLSPEGYGPVRIAMTVAEAERALGGPLEFDTGDGVDPTLCRYGSSSGIPGVRVMVENGRVARFDLQQGGKALTDKGLGLGDTRDEVRAAYGSALRQEPHKYEDAPAGYLEAWNADRSRGVRYEIDKAGRVDAVYAGGPAVGYVEGCA